VGEEGQVPLCDLAALAGHEEARCNLVVMDANSGYIGRAVNHWKIAAFSWAL